MTQRLWWAVTLSLAALLLVTSSAGAAPKAGAKLIGRWKAVAMEVGGKRYPVKPPAKIIFEFQRGGKFLASIAQGSRAMSKKGTWSATASKVTMTIEGKTEVLTYKVTGTRLKMTKTMAGKPVVHYMQRIR